MAIILSNLFNFFSLKDSLVVIKNTTTLCICCHTTANSVSKKVVKSLNISQSYKQERGCLVHFVRLATTLLNTKKVHEATTLLLESLRNSHRFLKKTFTDRLSN